MGFIEETGAAQFYRDARILAIYEGTTAIQANDLVGRKTLRDGGAVARWLLDQVRQTEDALLARNDPAATRVAGPLKAAREALASAVDYVLANAAGKTNAVFAAAVPYLMLAGTTLAGWQMARALLASLDLKQEDRVPRRQDRHGAGLCAAQADPGAGAGRRGARLGRVRSTALTGTAPGWPRSTGGQPDRSRINPRRSGTAPHAASRPRRAAASPARTTAPPR